MSNMKGLLDKRTDGSMALYINGDLQFDSRDERIYHEALVLPALAVALSRSAQPLRVLMIGGGDGLSARELFKTEHVGKLDLVDYDPQILEFARTEIAELNDNSLSDPRLNIHIRDGWEFVDQCLQRDAHYDLIICDLTVPEDASGARFHTIDWYEKLSRLLSPEGVLAVNACSPQATPRAFFSIFNSLLSAKLDIRPLHVSIPSFSASGFGDDWGFFIASPKSISEHELADKFELLSPRHSLKSMNDVRQLFRFPARVFEYQVKAVPAALGSEILLSYFYNDSRLARSESQPEDATSALVDSFALECVSMTTPAADDRSTILPAYVNRELSQSLRLNEKLGAEKINTQELLTDVIALVPSVYRDQTPDL